MYNSKEFKKIVFSRFLRSPRGQKAGENGSRFSTEKNTSCYLEFAADSEYMIRFQKYDEKNGLIECTPF